MDFRPKKQNSMQARHARNAGHSTVRSLVPNAFKIIPDILAALVATLAGLAPYVASLHLVIPRSVNL